MIFSLKQDINEKSVHLWCVSLDCFSTYHPDLLQCLSPVEKERATRFRFERDRKRYEISHGALRIILGSYLRRAPQSVRFEICDTGKPELLVVSGDPLIKFNMSHSGEVMILGVTKNRRIGVDVEMISHRIDIIQIAEHYFTAAEAAEIRETPAGKQRERFFTHWTCKEAYLKAIGSGLAGGLQSFSLSEKDYLWTISSKSDNSSRHLDYWTIRSMTLMDGYAAAVAIEGTGLDIRLFGTYEERGEVCCAERSRTQSGLTMSGIAG